MTRSAAVTVRRPGASKGTRDQHQNVAPDRSGEEATKGLHPGGQHLGHARRHGTGLRLGGCSRGPTHASGGGHDGRR